MGDLWTPGQLSVIRKEGTAKVKEEEEAQALLDAERARQEQEAAVPLPRWTPKTWRKAGEASAKEETGDSTTEVRKEEPIDDAEIPAPLLEIKEGIIVKAEEPSEALNTAPHPEPALSTETAPVFKKRKRPAAAQSTKT